MTQPPLPAISAPSGGVGSSTRSSQPSGRWTGRGPFVWPRAARSAFSRISARGRDERAPSRGRPRCRRGRPLGAGGFRPGSRSGTSWRACGRTSCRSPRRPTPRGGPAWSRMTVATSPRSGGGWTGRPAKASTRSRNSHGRPRQPRPTTTPSHPVSASMASASDASQMSPLPSTGIVVTWAFERGDGVPPGRPAVQLLGRAGVEGHRSHALLLGDAAGVQVGEQRVVHAHAELDRDGDGSRCRHRSSDDVAEQGGANGKGRATPLAGHLRDGATEVHVDVVHAHLIDEVAHGRAERARISAVELHRPGGFGAVEAEHGQSALVALHEGAGRDHLGHVEPGPEPRADPPERSVGHTGHRSQHHRGIDGERPDVQRCDGRLPAAFCVRKSGSSAALRTRNRGRVRHRAHSSVIAMSRSWSKRRRSGSERPRTLPWSPSMRSTNGAAYPSIVNAPATARGSSVAR